MHVLRMCIRALDYLPPVDVTFGEYLRALITADTDLVPDDDLGYRIAMIEAFRRRGIYPTDCRSLAVDSLLWNKPTRELEIEQWLDQLNLKFTRRQDVADRTRGNIKPLTKWLEGLRDNGHEDQIKEMGLRLDRNAPRTIRRLGALPNFEVHAVRVARRVGPDGQNLPQLLIEITQSRDGYADQGVQEQFDGPDADGRSGEPDFIFRGGCTLIVDLQTGRPRYCIRKRIDSPQRLAAQRKLLFESEAASLGMTYFGMRNGKRVPPEEPFALLHRKV